MDHLPLGRVTAFSIVGSYELDVSFDDGLTQRVNLSEMLEGKLLLRQSLDRGAVQRVSLDVFVERADAQLLPGKWSAGERSLDGPSDIFPAS